MSSYVSTVTIADREWAEIQKKVCDTNVYVARKRAEAIRLGEEAKKREEELRRMREQAEKTVNSAITLLQGGFDSALDRLRTEGGSSLRRDAQSVREEIAALKDDIRATASKTTAASSRLTKISQRYAEVMGALVKQEKDSAKSAQAYLDSVLSVQNQIEALHPEAFELPAYLELRQIIKAAEESIKAGRYQASHIDSQSGLLKASQLLTRLILANESFHGELTAATELADTLKTRFDRLDSCMEGAIEFEIDGEKYEYEYDIDHWSQGRFSQLRKEFETCRMQLREAKEHYAPLTRIEALKKTLEALGKKLDRCDAAARAEMIGSLKAEETAARINDSLPECWELAEHGFDDGDDRNPYKLLYKDGAGNSISVVVSPGVSAEKPSIFLEAFAEDEDRAEIIKRDIISAKLPNEGICVEQPRHLNDCHKNPDGRTFVQNTLPQAAALNEQRRQRSFGS